MKILAFTDIHANRAALKMIEKGSKSADVLVCAGDFTIFGNGMKKVMAAFGKIKKDVILVHGNHENGKEAEKEAAKYRNVHFIHRKSIKYGGHEFAGYGGGGFALVDKEFERFIKRFERKKKLILVTHAPPFGTRLDRLPFGHCGSKSYAKFIKKAQPELMICGHIHENERKIDRIGKTTIINPGHHGVIIEV